MAVIKDFDEFVGVHGLLLASSGIPSCLYHELFLKLSSDRFDGGDFFEIESCEDGRQRRLILSSESMNKDSHVFLVDHAWSFRLPDARKQNLRFLQLRNMSCRLNGESMLPQGMGKDRPQLQDVQGLAERMAVLMCVAEGSVSTFAALNNEAKELEDGIPVDNPMDVVMRKFDESREGGEVVRWLELEELDIDDTMLLSFDIPSKFPDLLALNLWGNKIQNVETVINEITNGDTIMDLLLQGLPDLEIYNSEFTRNYTEWAVGFAARIYGSERPCLDNVTDQLVDITNLDLSNRCIHKLSDKVFSPTAMPLLQNLNIRGNPLDEGSSPDLFKLLRGFNCLQSLEVDIPGPLGRNAVEIIESLPLLSSLNGTPASKITEDEKEIVDSILEPRLPEWDAGEPLIERVMSAMWFYMMTYRLADEQKIDETPVWYFLQLLGYKLLVFDLEMPNLNLLERDIYQMMLKVVTLIS
ncbi:Tubulin--tyrosine ligase-like protein 12 [Nymphaea thermarum]|nr:Tubulin--tyrosine ligase-like protein 12 [Nymphaea thermarum]